MDLVKSSYAGIKRTVRAVISPDPAGDPQKVDWEDATVLDPFRFPIGEPTERPVAAKLAHDDRNLYVALEQRGDARALAEPDAWQLLLAPQEGKPYRQVQVAVKGHQAVVECNDVSETGTKPSEIAVTAAVDRKPDSITIYLALPLKDLAPGGVQPGGDIYANIIRCTKGSDQPMWMPTFGEPDVASHLGYLVLERLRNPQSFTQTVDPAQLRQGLVGEWLMDETSGEVVKDSSGNGLDGKVFNSAEWGPGKVNGGFICEDSQFADFGNDPKTRLTTSVTIAAWINPSRWSDWCPTVMAKGYENGGYSLHIRSDWSLWFELDDAEGKRHYYNPTEITLTQKAWSHVAASYDGQTMRVYINGHEVGDGLPCSITIKDTPQPLRVCYSWGLGYFVGIMDEVRLYNRALSQPEILGLYRMGKGG
jgi:hypothetical protein